MEEEKYIELENLLTELRVILLKEVSKPSINNNIRDIAWKSIRNIDFLKRHIPLEVNNMRFIEGKPYEEEKIEEK